MLTLRHRSRDAAAPATIRTNSAAVRFHAPCCGIQYMALLCCLFRFAAATVRQYAFSRACQHMLRARKEGDEMLTLAALTRA